MEIVCPSCGKKFSWGTPKDVEIMETLTVESLEERTRRFVTTCPHCKRTVEIHV